MTSVSRRTALQATALGGLALFVPLPLSPARALRVEGAESLNAWVHVSTDDRVVILVQNAEMGQGIFTALPQIVADEMDARWDQVEAKTAPADPVFENPLFGQQGTGGSTTVKGAYTLMRQAGAKARVMLIDGAARRFSLPPTEFRTHEGRVIHDGTGLSVPFGEIADEAARGRDPGNVPLKEPEQLRYIGTAMQRLEVPGKVDGSAVFGADVDLPGVRTAVVKACPVAGGRLVSVDEAPAREVRGVEAVVRLGNAVAVVGTGFWPAKKGMDALSPQWDEGSNATAASAALRQEYLSAFSPPTAPVITAHGDLDTVIATAQANQPVGRQDPRTKWLIARAGYELPYLDHAPMEPVTATVRITGSKADVWIPTQSPAAVRSAVARTLGLDAADVAVQGTFLGGGFGRKGEVDMAIQAAQIAKASGHPIRLVWTREEDMTQGSFRPMVMASMTGFFDPAVPTRKLLGVHGRVVCGSVGRSMGRDPGNGFDRIMAEGLRDSPYDFPSLRLEMVHKPSPLREGFWRSVGHSHNAFIMESFVDECATVAGVDPVAFRLGLLGEGHPRHVAALKRVAELAGWGRAPLGRAQGVALHESFGSIAAMVVEVSVRERALTLHKVTCVIDAGPVVHPRLVKDQIEGGAVYGLTAALFGQITVQNGRVQQSNFDTYPMLLMSQMPAVTVEITDSPDAPMGGIGEPGTPPAAPALCNALFAATGKRIRSLPITAAGFTMAS